MFELKKFAMHLGIAEKLFLHFSEVAGLNSSKKPSLEQCTNFACLLFFPTANISTEELLVRLQRCAVHAYYYPKTMSPSGGKWHFTEDLDEYFVDEKWSKERPLNGSDAPLRQLNASLFPYNGDDVLSLSFAVGELLRNAHNLTALSIERPTLMASSVAYNPDANFGRIRFLKSKYDYELKTYIAAWDEETNRPSMSYDLEFGDEENVSKLIHREVDVPFSTIRSLGYAMRADELM